MTGKEEDATAALSMLWRRVEPSVASTSSRVRALASDCIATVVWSPFTPIKWAKKHSKIITMSMSTLNSRQEVSIKKPRNRSHTGSGPVRTSYSHVHAALVSALTRLMYISRYNRRQRLIKMDSQ